MLRNKTLNGGSSPRVWGTLDLLLLLIDPPRFIPTGVGNTRRSCAQCSITAVHPHGCGEHLRGA